MGFTERSVSIYEVRQIFDLAFEKRKDKNQIKDLAKCITRNLVYFYTLRFIH